MNILKVINVIKIVNVKRSLFMLIFFSSFSFSQDQQEVIIEISGAELTAMVWQPETAGGETIIALPWGGGSAVGYRYIGPLLAKAGYRLIALNPRGIDGSTGEYGNLTLHNYAEDVAMVIDSLKVNRAHIMGWALGNRVARTVATDYPSKVGTVSLLAAGGLVKPETSLEDLGRLMRERDMPLEEQLEIARSGMFSPRASETLIIEFLKNSGNWRAAHAARSAANRATPLAEWWAGGIAPMLIVQGLDDKVAPPENGRRMLEEFGDRVTLINIEESGHVMGLEKPLETVNAIVDFLIQNPL